jgi:hypothetical protein
MVLWAALALSIVAGLSAGEERAWGEAKGALQVSLVAGPEVPFRGAFQVRAGLRPFDEAVALPPQADVFAWVFVAQDGGDGKKGYFTEKLRIEPAEAWPKELPPAKVIEFKAQDIAATGLYVYRKGIKVLHGYPIMDAPDEKIERAGTLAQILVPGKASLRLMLCLPRDKDRSVLVTSNTVEVLVVAGNAQQAKVAELLKQFDRDAFAAKTAHEAAVKLGPEIVPDLVRAVRLPQRPEYSRLWLATTIADIPGEQSVAALTELLQDPVPGLRGVIAYYGPKQKNDALDKLILTQAKSGRDGQFTAYALLGFMVFRTTVPPELLAAGLESSDPRARSTAVSAIGGSANDFNIARLKTLVKDKDDRVRGAAQKVLEIMEKARKE